MYRNVFGPDYNLISFDPRGVRFSEPSLDCFQGNREARRNHEFSLINLLPSESPTALNSILELSKAYGDLCGKNLNDSARYVATPAVVQDMIHFTEKQALKNGRTPAEAKQTKLNYYGISYGTVLGQTLATMFPERIERIVIDSVATVDEYYTGGWKNSMYDSDLAFRTFFEYCYAAGPRACAFYESSIEDIESRFRKLMTSIREHPIPISDPALVPAPILLNIGLFKKVYFGTAIYGPAAGFPVLAKILTEFEKGNATAIPLTSTIGSPCYGCDIKKVPWEAVQTTSMIGIACLDADGKTNISTTEAFKEHLDDLTSLSFYAGDFWAPTAVACNNWKFKPVQSQKFDPSKCSSSSAPTLWPASNRSHSRPAQFAWEY